MMKHGIFPSPNDWSRLAPDLGRWSRPVVDGAGLAFKSLKVPFTAMNVYDLERRDQTFLAIGLTNPTEPTYVHASAILHAACHNGTLEEFERDLNKSYAVLQDFKAVVRPSTKRGKHSLELPADVKYKRGPPVWRRWL